MKSNEIVGWLEPNGICHYSSGMILENRDYTKVVIIPERNVIKVDTDKSNWRNLSIPQKRWLYEASVNGYEVSKNVIFSGTMPINSPLKIQVNKPKNELVTEKITFKNVLKESLILEMSFDQLVSISKNKPDNSRVDRANHVVPYSQGFRAMKAGQKMPFRPMKAGKNLPFGADPYDKEARKKMDVNAIVNGMVALFNYKSSDPHSTTGERHHGYIQFLNNPNNDCRVHCSCPDYFNRWEYNNAEAGVGDYCAGHNRQPPKPTGPPHYGVGDLGVGLCKHLLALVGYVRTKTDAPTPEDDIIPTKDKELPVKKPLPVKKIKPTKKIKPVVKPTAAPAPTPVPEPVKPTTSIAPDPEDDYSDSRTGSLEEVISSRTFWNIAQLANSQPNFELSFDDDESVKEELYEDYHHYHKDYRLYEGNSHITVIFEDNSRLAFEVHYHNNHGEDKLKHREKAAKRWKSLASKIHNDVTLDDACNEVQKSWKESFKEALKHPDLQEYIRQSYHKRVFAKEDDVASCMDPVNFTRFG